MLIKAVRSDWNGAGVKLWANYALKDIQDEEQLILFRGEDV